MTLAESVVELDTMRVLPDTEQLIGMGVGIDTPFEEVSVRFGFTQREWASYCYERLSLDARKSSGTYFIPVFDVIGLVSGTVPAYQQHTNVLRLTSAAARDGDYHKTIGLFSIMGSEAASRTVFEDTRLKNFLRVDIATMLFPWSRPKKEDNRSSQACREERAKYGNMLAKAAPHITSYIELSIQALSLLRASQNTEIPPEGRQGYMYALQGCLIARMKDVLGFESLYIKGLTRDVISSIEQYCGKIGVLTSEEAAILTQIYCDFSMRSF